MIAVDWLTVFQVHAGADLPVVGAEWRVSTSIETGEEVYKCVTGLQHEGSFDTWLRVRCDGSRVEVSGNPSAFDQRDNVFGCSSVGQALAVYNGVLRRMGLPIFEEHEVTHCAPRQFAHTETVMPAGPRITRVDLCENFACGDVGLALRFLSGYVHHGTRGKLYGNGSTVDWGGGSRVYIKAYDKAADIDSKRAGLEKTLKREQNEDARAALQGQIAYLGRLAEWCRQVGLIRTEVSYKRRELYRQGLQRPGTWDTADMGELITKYQFHRRLNVENGELLNVADRLQAEGYTGRDSFRYELAFRSWYTGADLKAMMPKTSFYRARKALLLCGVDISRTCDVSVLPIKTAKIEFREVSPPVWYRQAA
jgi:II/X family phage/plasmid replication protein